MALFGFGKQKEEKKTSACCCTDTPTDTNTDACCCSAQTSDEQNACCGSPAPADGICCIKILGAGCKSCHEMYENAKKAVKAMGLNLEVEYVTDMETIMNYGVMSMPAVVVNEKVVSMGKVLKTADLEKLFGAQ